MSLIKNQAFPFAIGIFIGTALFVMIPGAFKSNHRKNISVVNHSQRNLINNIRFYKKTFKTDDYYDFSDNPIPLSMTAIIPKHGETVKKKAPEVDVDKLFKTVKVLCWVLTTPKNHKKRALHIKRTWGRRCNKLVFMSSISDPLINSEPLNITTNANSLWGKSKLALSTIYENYLDEADWFLKADDDTYVIMENLRNFLKDYDGDENHFFGYNLQDFQEKMSPFMSEEAGYVLSKGALTKFVKKALPNRRKCRRSNKGHEFIELVKCLRHVGISLDDSRDNEGRRRFLSFTPDTFFKPGTEPGGFWWNRFIIFPQNGIQCCSPTAISFHFVQPSQMYLFDFLLYFVRPVGISKNEKYFKPPSENLNALSKQQKKLKKNKTKPAKKSNKQKKQKKLKIKNKDSLIKSNKHQKKSNLK